MPRTKRMGHVHTVVTFIGPTGKTEALSMLVDTGASYTWVPDRLLRALGVHRLRQARLRLGDGRVVRRQLGEVLVEIMGNRATTVVVFAREGDATVLGVHALEGLALEVDPAREALRPMDYLLFLATA